MKKRGLGPKHGVLPDVQLAPGDSLDHVAWAARYFRDKRPDVIVCLGDFFDMESLSSYEQPGSVHMEGKRYREDLDIGNRALALFHKELAKAGRSYRPRLVVTLGNHEARVTRAIDAQPKLIGTMGLDDLHFARYGWEVYPFLKIVEVDHILYSHLFCVGANGRVTSPKYGQPSAATQVKRLFRSATAGHRQGLDVAIHSTPFATYRGVIAGSYYEKALPYLTNQGQNNWAGLLMKHDIDRHGGYDLLEVSLRWLRKRFG